MVLREENSIMEQKVKQDEICIGKNIREICKQYGIGQTEFVRLLQLEGVDIIRETLVKMEHRIQHIKATQLRAMRDVLETAYEELLRV